MIGDIDISAISTLGLVDENDDAIITDEVDDPDVLAEYAALESGRMTLDAEVKALKVSAVQLKRAGDATGAIAKLREAKALEARADKQELVEMPAMEALSEVVLPGDEDLSCLSEDDERLLAKELGGISKKDTGDGRSLKLEALERKRKGDVQGALELMRRSKVIEAGATALKKIEVIQRCGYEAEWRGFRSAVNGALHDCVRDGKKAAQDGDRAAAARAAQRGKQLKAMLQSPVDTSAPPPKWHRADVIEERRVIDENVEAGIVVIRFEDLSLVCDPSGGASMPARCRPRVRLELGDGVSIFAETEPVDLDASRMPVLVAPSTELGLVLDKKALANSQLCKMRVANDSHTKRAIEAAKRAMTKLARAKLYVELWVSGSSAGGLSGLFSRREILAFTAKTTLEPLIDRAYHSRALKLRRHEDPVPTLRAASLVLHLSLREPLRDPLVQRIVVRRDINVELPAADNEKAPLRAAAVAAHQNVPPPIERDDPHGPTLLLSDKVLDHELSLVTATSADLAATARKLSLQTAKDLLESEVNSGNLTPEAYAERIKARLARDKVLALWLGKQSGRKSDAARVLKRIKLAQEELAELAAYM